MGKNTIIVKECTNIPTDKDYKVYDNLSEILRLLRYDDNAVLIKKIFDKQNKLFEEYNIDRKRRLQDLIPTLNKYWKMSIYQKEKNNDEFIANVFYVHPYRLIPENETYWCLRIHGNNIYKGIEDTNFDISELTNKLVFEEITEEEFRQKVVSHSLNIINTRLTKEKITNELV